MATPTDQIAPPYWTASWTRPFDPGADRDMVIATEGVDVEPVAVGVGVGDAHGGREAVHADRVTARGHGDRVVPGRAGDGDEVLLVVGRRAAADRREVHVDAREVGPRQVPDRDLLVPEEGPEADRLDGVEVHDDVADVAGDRDPADIGRDAEDLVVVGPGEDEGVGAAPAPDDVRAIARVPGERVVAAAEGRRVGTPVAVDDVVAAAADERLVAVAADEGVVAALAVDRASASRS